MTSSWRDIGALKQPWCLLVQELARECPKRTQMISGGEWCRHFCSGPKRSAVYHNLVDFIYISEKTVRRVVDLYLSTGSLYPKKKRYGPLNKLSDHRVLLILDSIDIQLISSAWNKNRPHHSPPQIIWICSWHFRSNLCTSRHYSSHR